MWYVITGVTIAMIILTMLEMFGHIVSKEHDLVAGEKVMLFVLIGVIWPAIIIAFLVMLIKDNNY